MITVEKYYSSELILEEEQEVITCLNCGKRFRAGLILLDIVDKDFEIIDEYCPYCLKKGMMKNLDESI